MAKRLHWTQTPAGRKRMREIQARRRGETLKDTPEPSQLESEFSRMLWELALGKVQEEVNATMAKLRKFLLE